MENGKRKMVNETQTQYEYWNWTQCNENYWKLISKQNLQNANLQLLLRICSWYFCSLVVR